MTRLVLAPHADDESLGCGGMLAKHAQDSQVVVITEPTPKRLREFHRARDRLGYTKFSVLNYVDGSAGVSMPALVATLDDLYAATEPEEVYLPYPGLHQDHVAVYEAGMRASRLSMSGRHWSPPTVLVYDVPVYDLELQSWPLRFSVFERLTDEHVSAKADAVECYESQRVTGPHSGSPDEVVMQAGVLGAARGFRYAEQFAPVRMVRS